MNSKKCIILLFLFVSANSFSQVLNVDRIKTKDTVFKKWVRLVNISLSADKVQKTIIELDTRLEVNRFLKNDYILIGSARGELKFNGSNALKQEGYVHFRYRDNDKRNYSLLSYLQYSWDDALGMEHREVAGSDLRKRVFDKARTNLYTTLGMFYEGEKWNYSAVPNSAPANGPDTKVRNIFRLNHSWKFAHKVNDNMDISAISYFQFPLNDHFLNLRWFVDINANFKITKKASFVIHWDHTYDDYRVVPISNFYYSLDFGTKIVW